MPNPAGPAPAAPMLPPGSYWTAIASYHDGSGILGTYGPYPSKTIAEEHAAALRAAGVYPLESWEIQPLRSIGLGQQHGEKAALKAASRG